MRITKQEAATELEISLGASDAEIRTAYKVFELGRGAQLQHAI